MEDETGNKYEKSLNRVQIIGRLGRDAELRGSDQRSVVVLSVATNDVYTKQSGERVSHVDWHRISVFQPNLRDKIAINLKKGDRVFLAGKIRYDEYRDNDNVLRRSASILAGYFLI
ncbi:hypothetical protein SNE40_003098 [Patella caerulea]|uniref:Single-stranded DNA-binding protein n=1 Tax=Patella caerulea TaxID=87958 RepID=A0AAN8KD66_PATCE